MTQPKSLDEVTSTAVQADHMEPRTQDVAVSAALWEPTPQSLQHANITSYLSWLTDTRGRTFTDYRDLWQWSVDDLPGFWGSIWDYYKLNTITSYDEVLADPTMPGAQWFTGAKLNFAQHCLLAGDDDTTALICVSEDHAPVGVTYAELRRQVAAIAAALRGLGVRAGDCVAGYLPNIAEAVVGMLATTSIGAVWTVASPDFGTPSVLARLRQAAPTVLIAADGYRYGGKEYDRRATVADLVSDLPSVRHLLTVNYLHSQNREPWITSPLVGELRWENALSTPGTLAFADLDFDHPLWILWSSGTTGTPKGIVHGHGGITIELLKALSLGADLNADDRFFFVTSTSWMVWNFMVGGLLLGATIVLYDGSPTYPDIDGAWRVAEATGATAIGVGAGYLIAGNKAQSTPAVHLDLGALRSILQTGSTLPPDAWQWTCDHVKPGVWLQSVCGGTDICSALAGATPLLAVYPGRLQAPALGVALQAWDDDGHPVVGREGELVVTKPMPSMPLYFLNDHDGSRYHDSYFNTYPGVWRHGDWITINPDQSIIVSGRSDSTLNRMGVRMGSADIYAVIDQIPDIADSLVIGVEQPDGGYHMPLFIVPADGVTVDDDLCARITSAVRTQLSPRHVPDAVVEIASVPRTRTGKRLEVPVKRILQGIPVDEVANTGTLSNPEMLNWFAHYAQAMKDRQPAPPPQQLLSPLVGERVVHRITTDPAVRDVTDVGFRLVESAPGVTESEVRAATEPDLVSGPA